MIRGLKRLKNFFYAFWGILKQLLGVLPERGCAYIYIFIAVD